MKVIQTGNNLVVIGFISIVRGLRIPKTKVDLYSLAYIVIV